MQSQKQQKEAGSFPRQIIQHHSNPSLCPNHYAKEAEVDQFYKDLQNLLELTPKKDVLFIIGNWNTKVGSQKIPGVTDKFGLGVQNEAGQMLTEFCQEAGQVMWYSHVFQNFPQFIVINLQSQKRQNDLCSFPRQITQYHGNPRLCHNH